MDKGSEKARLSMLQLSVEHVSISYERTLVLKDISFEVEEGDYICIVGENGSGKSSLIKGILGLIPLKEGKTVFYGDTLRARAGYLPQQTQLQKDFPASVMEVVLSGCLSGKGWRPFYSREEKEMACEKLRQLGMEDVRRRSYRKLSGGQQQRVLLARALCATDKIIFLDEPISGLDPMATAEFYQLIGQLNKEKHISVVMVSHDIGTALKEANKVLHIKKDGYFFGSRAEYQRSSAGRELFHINEERDYGCAE